MECYVFENLETAINAEQWLCDKACELGMGYKQNPDDITECYAIPRVRDDNKAYFPRISIYVRSRLNEVDIVSFMTLFSPTIEEYDENWINVGE